MRRRTPIADMRAHTRIQSRSNPILDVLSRSLFIPRLLSIIRWPAIHCKSFQDIHSEDQALTYLARFFAATIAPAPTAYAPNRFLQLPL